MSKQYRFMTSVFLTALFLLPVLKQRSEILAEPERSFINSTINNPLSDDEFYFRVSRVKWRSASLANGLKIPQAKTLNKNARNLSTAVLDSSLWFSGVVNPQDLAAAQIELGHKFKSGNISTDISIGYLQGTTVLVPGNLEDSSSVNINVGGTPTVMGQSVQQPFWYKDIPVRRMNFTIDVNYNPWQERATSLIRGLSFKGGFDYIMDNIDMKGQNLQISSSPGGMSFMTFPAIPGNSKASFSQAVMDVRMGLQYDFSFTPAQTVSVGYSAIAYGAGGGESKNTIGRITEKDRFEMSSQGWRANLAYTYSFGVHAIQLSVSNAKTDQKITSISSKLKTGLLMTMGNIFAVMAGDYEPLLFDIIGNSANPFGPYPASTDYITAISIAYIYRI